VSFDPRHLTPGHLDHAFLAVDADTRFGDVLDLIGDLSPRRVVIRDDDDDDDRFLVLSGGRAWR
jgi:hypothetical protein